MSVERRFLGSLVVLIILLAGCELNGDSKQITKNYGGVFKYCENNRINIIHPSLISNPSAKRIGSQVFEGLVKLDAENLEVKPCIAKEISFNPDNFTYTFKLKKGVFFHDDPCFVNGVGREVTCDDIIFTFKQLCTNQLINASYYNTLKSVVTGADAYFNGEGSDISGIKKINKYQLDITLNKPNSSFLKKIAGVNFGIIAKEAVMKYGLKNKVGTGPFIPQPFDSYNDEYVLIKNKNYHRSDKFGNKLPFLDSIIVSFELGIKQQMNAVINGELSTALNLSVKAVKRVLRDHNDLFDDKIKMQNSSFLSTCYIECNLNSPKLANKDFRKALSYAINKSIITQMAFGETRGKVGNIGITHPSITEYRTGRIHGYSYNLDSAKLYLSKAGFAEVPTLEIEIGENNFKAQGIANELQLQLDQNLGIQLKINIVPERYKLEKTRYARSELAISYIVSEYESPEGFLNMFYSKGIPTNLDIPSYPNTTRFKNRSFDKMMDRGRKSVDTENANRSFASAERLLMEEAPIVVLWYEEVNRLVDSNIEGFPLNKLLYIDLSEVYLK
jgi:peptide/nickel transport system substrate-binding protein